MPRILRSRARTGEKIKCCPIEFIELLTTPCPQGAGILGSLGLLM